MKIPRSPKANKIVAILRPVLLVFAAAVIGINAYLWNARNLVGNTTPMPFGHGCAVILSGSMEPTLKVNDLVVIREEESYAAGDIVVFQSGGDRIIHRIAAIDGETVLTKGDANPVADSPIHISQIKGKLVLRLPGVGVPVRFLKTPAGIISVLALAVALLEWSYRRERQEKEDTQEMIKEEIRRLREEMQSGE